MALTIDLEKGVLIPSLRARRVLIVGMSGYLGSALAIGLRDHFEVFGTFYKNPIHLRGCTALRMDATNSGEIVDIMQLVSPDVILYCAGIRSVEDAERDPSNAEALNFKAISIFFKVMRPKSHFVYFNEDRVFDAKTASEHQVLTENINPMVSPNVASFSRSKIQGETIVRARHHNSHVFRLGALYGECMGSPMHLNPNWLSSSLESLQKGHQQFYLDQTTRSFVYLGDVVRALRIFLTRVPLEPGVYHLANSAHPQSYFDFASLIQKFWNIDAELVTAQRYQKNAHISAWGPEHCVLDSSKFSLNFDFKFQAPEQGLQEMSERMRFGFSSSWP